MNHSDQLRRLVVELELAIPEFPYSSVEDWATAELASGDPHPSAFDLFDRQCDVAAILKRIATERLAFDPRSTDADRFIGHIASEYLTRFLAREISPAQLCEFVGQIDSHYIDHDLPAPEWVAILYNSCDWCDDTWTHSTMPHLVQDARTVLHSLSLP